jgi:hypothetical protein
VRDRDSPLCEFFPKIESDPPQQLRDGLAAISQASAYSLAHDPLHGRGDLGHEATPQPSAAQPRASFEPSDHRAAPIATRSNAIFSPKKSTDLTSTASARLRRLDCRG